MRVLEGLQPVSVFYFFEEICGIPHISGNEKELSDYCVNFAKERGLYWEQDAIGNVILIKEATAGYEDVEPMIVQGHLDMVGDKVPECPLDLEKDAIKLQVDGDYVTAEGTTLGGDDGIAVAYGLALLDAKDIPHPRLEVVLTVGEEVGLDGAAAIDLSCCKAKRLLNIDSELEGIFTVGCAGGMRADCEIPVETAEKSGVLCTLTSKGFLGGHSGIEIHKGRANANVIIGRCLLFLQEKLDFALVQMSGGVKDNVIPKNATASILLAGADVENAKAVIGEFNQILKQEYGASDPDVALEFAIAGGKEISCKVLSEESKDKTIVALTLMPNGVQSMCMDLPDLVETSLNMGIVSCDENGLQLCFSVRSSIESAKDFVGDKLKKMTEFLGGTISYHGQYPGWAYARESKLRDLCVKVYEKQYGEAPKIEIIHAGLECGLFSAKIAGLDCISIGPNMQDIHTPDERLSISSVARVWEFIKGVLAEKEL
ncbi:MAG: aminoacyl-histidine dipeptidase [Faecalimonas sp.]|nr:aminoacyl-histidine dipeptidase [Faecalimonas sp.]